MKKTIKLLGFSLILILALSLSLGCDKEVKSEDLSKIYTDFGFLENIIKEDEGNFVDFKVNDDTVNLKVNDEIIFNKLKEDDFYKFIFNDKNVLLSLENDPYLESLVRNSQDNNEDSENDPESESRISSQSKVSTDNLTLLDSFEFDINNNGFEEKIAIYAQVEKDPSGEIYWDDGQNWLFLVEGEEEDFILFDDFLQISTLDFYVFTVDDDFYITTIESGTANLEVKEFIFEQASNEFVSKTKYKTGGNVNMLYSNSSY